MGSGQTLDHNIEAMIHARREDEAHRSITVRFADRVTAFVGSVAFLIVQTIAIGVWLVWNMGVFGLPVFDPFPFQMLTLVLSIEAIYLTVFVLISQNRMSEIAERRAEVDLQINLLDERESTRILRIVDAIATKVGADIVRDQDLEDLEMDVKPEDVMARVEAREHPKAPT